MPNNPFLDLLRLRRSVRRFTPEAVSAADIALLEEALLRSPSSRGINPWEFIIVSNPALIAELAKAKQGAALLASAPLAVVITAHETKSDVWIEDASIAAILCQLAAASLGLGSCWVQIRTRPHSPTVTAEDYVRSLLALPSTSRILCIVAVGHPDEHPAPHGRASLSTDKVHHIP